MNPSETSKDQLWRGTVTMVTAALFYASGSTTVKLMTGYLTFWQTAIGRFAFGVLLIPMIAWASGLELFGRNRRLMVVRGFSGTVSFLLLIQALRTISLSTGMILFYLWPVFCCLLSPWIARESVTRREWPFVLTALIGTVMIFWPEKSSFGLGLGHLEALGASFFAGLTISLTRRLGRNNHPLILYFYFCLVGGLVSVGPLLAQNMPLLPSSAAGWFGLMGIALFSLLGQVLMNQGMRFLDAPRTGVIMMIEPLFTSVIGAVFLNENMNFALVAGGCLILGSGVALIFQSSARSSSPVSIVGKAERRT